jgi:hypothetical protein
VSNDGCRFCKLYAIALVGIACFLGALQTLQFAVSLSELAGVELAWRLLLLSALRSIAPAANGTALLLALLIWSQLVSPAALALELPGKLKRGLLLSLLGYPAAVLLVAAVSLLIATSFFAMPLDALPRALRVVKLGDVGIGYLSALVDALVISFVAWRGLPALHAGKLSLPAKIAVALPVLFVLRALVGLALPGGEAN